MIPASIVIDGMGALTILGLAVVALGFYAAHRDYKLEPKAAAAPKKPGAPKAAAAQSVAAAPEWDRGAA